MSSEFPTCYITARVIKRNKRLMIQCLENGEILYCPPDFIRDKLKSREPLIELAEKMLTTDTIKLIMEFEKKVLDKDSQRGII